MRQIVCILNQMDFCITLALTYTILYNTSCLCKWWVDGLQYLNGGMFGTDTANHMRCGQNMSKAHSKKHGMVGLRLCDGYV